MTDRKKKVVKLTAVVFAVLLVALIAWRIQVNQAANKERANRVAQGKATVVEMAAVGRQDVDAFYGFSGNLEPVWSADISAKVDGRIDRLNVEEGSSVSAGTIIASLDSNELEAQVLQAQGNLDAAKASLEQANVDLNRSEILVKQGAVAQQSLDSARIKRDLALGQVRAAEGNLALVRSRLEGTNIVAPRPGIVVKRYIQAGYYAKTGSPIVSVADVSTMLAKATVGEAEVSQLTVGQNVIVKVDALPDKEFAGTITRISPMAAQPARTFTAEVSIPNGSNILKAGMFARVMVKGQTHKNVLAVPERALVMREDQKTVFVVTADSHVQQRVLKIGTMSNGWVEVLEGAAEGEKIVTAGQNKIKDGMSVSSGAPGEGGN